MVSNIYNMKILHVIDSLDVGGAERVAITLANVFAEKGHETGMLILYLVLIRYYIFLIQMLKNIY